MGHVKPKKRANKLQSRIKHFESDRSMIDMRNKYPGSYTKPGSLQK